MNYRIGLVFVLLGVVLTAGVLLWAVDVGTQEEIVSESRLAVPTGKQQDDNRHVIRAQLPRTDPPVRLELPPSLRIRGFVTDLAGEGIVGAKVAFEVKRASGLEALAQGITGSAGTYDLDISRLSTLPPQEFPGLSIRGLAWKEGHAASPHGFIRGFHPEKGSGQTLTMNFVLGAGGTVAGLVVDSHGRPVADTKVALQSYDDGDEPHEWRLTRSDHLGKYRLACPSRGMYWLRGSKAGVGFGFVGPIRLDPRSSTRIPDLVLRGRGSIAGVALYTNGEPAEGLRLSCQWTGLFPWKQAVRKLSGKGGRQRALLSKSKELQGYTGMVTLFSGKGGKFEFNGLQPGKWRLSASSIADWRLGSGPKKVDVYETGTVDARLILSNKRIRYRVVDRKGRPVPWARVKGWGYSGAEKEKLEDLIAGGARLADARRRASPFDNFNHNLSWPEAWGGIQLRHDTGWIIQAESPGFGSEPQACFLSPGANEMTKTLVLKRSGSPGWLAFVNAGGSGVSATIDFRYVLAKRVPQQLARIRLAAQSPRDGTSCRVPAGDYKLHVFPNIDEEPSTPFLAITLDVRVAEGKPTPVKLDLSPGGWVSWSLKGAVKSKEQHQITWRDINIAMTSHAKSQTRRVEGGFLRKVRRKWTHATRGPILGEKILIASPFAPGWYTLKITVRGKKPSEKLVEVRANQETSVEVDLID